ncbi:uncharacterized protein PSANT_03221 [Moesziomyces antarcticus]|uniref:Uncharacterized protein n=1 Tax=Pseudozyma antarctica TaxID=84753 RepID=A0A5C3FP06_PSEA2|nr:uncharacterized protein PSANT_03221 [Moesziomyces antarcticus]
MVFLLALKRVLAVALLLCAAVKTAKATVLPDAEVIWRPGADVGNAIYDLAERLVNRARSHPDVFAAPPRDAVVAFFNSMERQGRTREQFDIVGWDWNQWFHTYRRCVIASHARAGETWAQGDQLQQQLDAWAQRTARQLGIPRNVPRRG